MGKTAKFMTRMLLFQASRTEDTALQAEFHVLGVRSYGVEITSEPTPEQFWGLVFNPIMFWCSGA